MTNRRHDRPVAVLVAGSATVAGVDLATKAAAPALEPAVPWLVHSLTNDELTLGVASAATGVLVAAMTVGLLAGALVAVRLVRHGRAAASACCLVLGGALGNLVDRAATGAVHDFLILGPVVINVADIAILAGLAAVGTTYARTRSAAPAVVEGR